MTAVRHHVVSITTAGQPLSPTISLKTATKQRPDSSKQRAVEYKPMGSVDYNIAHPASWPDVGFHTVFPSESITCPSKQGDCLHSDDTPIHPLTLDWVTVGRGGQSQWQCQPCLPACPVLGHPVQWLYPAVIVPSFPPPSPPQPLSCACFHSQINGSGACEV